MARKTREEMKRCECPSAHTGHGCRQMCKLEKCVHYIDATLPADAQEYGACLLWADAR